MAHFAQIDENDIVVNVMVIEQDMVDTGLFGDPNTFIKTSYNTFGGVHYGPDGQPDGGVALRKNFAGIGHKYDRERDAFISPKPHNSWTLNEETCLWEPPIPMPNDEFVYSWNEYTLSWEKLTSTQE